MRLRLFSLIVALLCSIGLVSAQMQNPVHWSFELSPIQTDGAATITYTASIDNSWHMYDVSEPENGPVPTSFKCSVLKNAELKGGILSKSKVIEKFEPAFGMSLRYFETVAVFQQKLKVKDVSKDVVVEGTVEFMCCNDQMCLPPAKTNFSLKTNGLDVKDVALHKSNVSPSANVAKEVVPPTEDTTLNAVAEVKSQPDSAIIPPVTEVIPTIKSVSLTEYGKESSSNTLWAIFLSGLLGGFIAVLTPCVWPIIPMTVSFFLKRNKDKQQGRKQALLYGLSIIIIYVTLGLLITGIFSANTLNAISTNAVFNVFLFLLLVFFACSFFGAFEIMLPASWSTAIDAKADQVSGILGILLMASTLVIVSFSCTGPIIGTLLVSVATTGSILAPAIGMLGFAIALAIPFSFFAFFPSLISSLPKSGNWLNMVKVLLGFFELAFSLKFLSVADQAYGWNLLSRPTFIAIWIVIFSLAGLYLLGKIKLPHDTDSSCVSVPRLLLALCSFSFAVYLLPGMFGAPLNVISAFAPPLSKADASFFPGVKVEAKYSDFDAAKQLAAQEGKPLLIDFTGHGCVNCRKMESAVWTDPNVADLLTNKCILVSLYCDDRTPLSQPERIDEGGKNVMLETVGEKWSCLQRKFGANSQPYYVMVYPDGSVYPFFFKFTENPSEFADFINDGIKSLKE